jgi:hypothetical protein
MTAHFFPGNATLDEDTPGAKSEEISITRCGTFSLAPP